ncbi:transglutaminase-like cysteine peptidase [Methylocapsa polymorpha]|uniref:Transglutaminase-like cysteine peptidase n=1 Tax=Methylocapsa polymorpha TaxID=3080828 RepID=A0ABZ0HP82_9HYPH|nr:transglutaminase-like cysteine peptidase [Methylocapsa sp. RX1]
MKDRAARSAQASGLASFHVLSACLGLFFGLSNWFAAVPSAHAAGAPRASYAPIGEPASVPYGWTDFCRRYDGECDDSPLPPIEINLTPKAAKEIERINKWVNAHIEPMSDMDHWGVVDQWDYPTDGKGDCEDYALLKRKLLIVEGFPRQALLMTVVKDTHNDGHALLTVRTNAGEFVLDNLNNEMKAWDQTGYRFVKRQSQTDPNAWVQLGDPTPAPDYVSR